MQPAVAQAINTVSVTTQVEPEQNVTADLHAKKATCMVPVIVHGAMRDAST